MNPVVNVIKKARRLLSDPKKWTKSTYARNARGAKCEPTDKQAACFCAIGALERYAQGDLDLLTQVEEFVNRVSVQLYDAHGIVHVNDRLPRGRQKVLKVFDTAIAELETR